MWCTDHSTLEVSGVHYAVVKPAGCAKTAHKKWVPKNIPLLLHARHVQASQSGSLHLLWAPPAPGQGLIPKAVDERLVQLMAHCFLRSCGAPCWRWPQKAPTWLSNVCSAGVGVCMRRTRLFNPS